MSKAEQSMSNFNIDEIVHIAKSAVNRAYIYSVLSEKVQWIDVPDIDLMRGCTFSLISKDVWKENQNSLKKFFLEWVTRKCIEDLVESFDYMIKELYSIIPVEKDAPRKFQKENFMNDQSLKERLKTLQRIGVDVKHKDCLESLALMRVCLTHRQGIVGNTDLKKSGNQFKAVWYYPCGSIKGKIKGEDYTTRLENVLPLPGFDNDTDVEISVEYEKRGKDFNFGEKIIFQAYEIQEICFTMIIAIDAFRNSFVAKLNDWGIPVQKVPKTD